MTLTRSNSLLITFGFLMLAMASYAIGFALPASLFIILGVAAELTFWVRVFRRKQS